MAKTKTGSVYLVGAGPGAPGLLTRRGAELIARADTLVHDALVPPALLREARPGAEIIPAGKRDGQASMAQEAIEALLVARARDGRTVVRLKGGDPYLFGRGGEEAAALARAGVPFEVVPGVSSFGAAASYAGIPLTHRGDASAFTVVSGHEDPSQPGGSVDWHRVAALPGTKVVLMGAARLPAITAALAEAGLDATTPAAVIQWGTTPGQRVVQGTLADLAGRAAAAGLGSPALAVFGDVVRHRPALCWFERLPLFGRRLLVPSTDPGAAPWKARLAGMGAEVVDLPTLRREIPTAREPMIESLAGLGEYDWLVFASPEGVDAFFSALFAAFEDIRAVGNARLAALSARTAARLAALHLRVEVAVESAAPEPLARAIAERETLENLRFLLVRGDTPSPDLNRRLEAEGAILDDVPFYHAVPLPASEDPEGALARLRAGEMHWVLFPDADSVNGFHARFGLPRLATLNPRPGVAALGAGATDALAALGCTPDFRAADADAGSLVDALATGPGKAPAA